MAIPVPGMAKAALNTATFIAPVAHGDIFITAPVLVVMTHPNRLAEVPEAGWPVPRLGRGTGQLAKVLQTRLPRG
jgi:hypothetical protein